MASFFRHNFGTPTHPRALATHGLSTAYGKTPPSYFSTIDAPVGCFTNRSIRPDNCDGTFQQNCDSSRAYTNISAILAKSAPSTLSFMQTYWKDISGNDESFWEHEFGKHATCISTLDPDCYTNYQPTQEVGDFFTRTVSLFQSLPSYDWLAAAGIVPSKTATYTLAAIQAALTAHHGHNVIINCDNGELNELWYQFNVRGSVQTGTFTPVDPVGSGSTCPKTGIKYLPKSGSPAPTTTLKTTSKAASSTKSSSGGSTPPPGGALSGKGFLYIDTSSTTSDGFLVSSGAWYRAGGTPATYTATPNGSTFTLSSSKGKCAILSDSSLSCSSSVSTASSFGYDGTHLTYQGSAKFYAAATPSGQDQGTVFASSHAVSVAIAWNAQ